MPERQPYSISPEAANVLREQWNSLPARSFSENFWPSNVPNTQPVVKSPSLFQPEPFVNDPDVQRMLHQILRVAPEIRNHLGTIQVGPNLNAMDVLRASDLNVDDYPRTNLQGVTGKTTHNISLNPSLVLGWGQRSELSRSRELEDPESLYETLVHELTHAAGGNERAALETGRSFTQAQKQRR